MAREQRELCGTIGKNRYPKDDKSPLFVGRCKIQGTEYHISGFQKVNTRDGSIFYSLSFRPIDESQQMDPQTGAGQADSPGF